MTDTITTEVLQDPPTTDTKVEQAPKNAMLDKFPTDEYEAKTFMFSKGEQLMVSSLDVMDAVYKQQARLLEEISHLPEGLLSGFLNNNILKRAGVKQCKDSGIFYDSLNGSVTVYLPKHMCVICDNRKVTQKLDGKGVCDDCAQAAKAVQTTPKEPSK
jgi:hypothetical protein